MWKPSYKGWKILKRRGHSFSRICTDLRKSAGYRGPTEETCFFLSLVYFWLRWVFVAAQAFSSCEEWHLLSTCGVEASHCGGFSCGGGQALGDRAWAVATHRLSSCGSQAREHRLSSWGAGAFWLCGRWGLARPERTHVPCTDRQIRIQGATGEVPLDLYMRRPSTCSQHQPHQCVSHRAHCTARHRL